MLGKFIQRNKQTWATEKAKNMKDRRRNQQKNNIFQKEVDDKRQRKKMEIWKGRQKENKEKQNRKKEGF